jgi:hydroxyethylthiazole kinase-like uncharacterized protein yjeF
MERANRMNCERSGGASEYLVLTAEAQREVDRAAVAAGTPSVELMESAGTSAADWILDRLAPSRVVVLAGSGGNGGDGLVVALELHRRGIDVRTYLLGRADDLREAPRAMLDRLRAAGGRVETIADAGEEVLRAVRSADWVVDGLFGTGLSRPLAGAAAELVERLNESGARVVSLDLPSGLDSDRGVRIGPTVRAQVTLAMAFLKPAHLLFPASSDCGNVAVVPVAYPNAVLVGVTPWARVPGPAGVRDRLPARRPNGHKGTFGRVLVVAGSSRMTGAAILCCRGALRSGAGLVTLAAPETLASTFDIALAEVIFEPLPAKDGAIAGIAEERIGELLKRADVLAIGPGLSRAQGSADVVRRLVGRFEGPIVLDADGIAAFVDRTKDLDRSEETLLLTPHPGELGRLLGVSSEAVDEDRVRVAAGFAGAHSCTVLLKGRPTAIATRSGDVWLNPTGNTGLATGGSGDVLTGMIAGFVAGGAPLVDAAILGAYLHGTAAEAFARDRSERACTPSDLVDLLPSVLKEAEAWR